MWEDSERRRQRIRVSVFVLALVTLVIAWFRLDSDSRSAPAIFSAIDAWFTGTPQPASRPVPSAAAADPGTPAGGRAAGPSGTVGTTGGTGRTGSRDLRVNPSPDRNAVTPGDPRPRLGFPREADASRTEEIATPPRPDPCDPRDESGRATTDPTRTGIPPCEDDEPSSARRPPAK